MGQKRTVRFVKLLLLSSRLIVPGAGTLIHRRPINVLD
jgi:hypothetical protein